MSAIAFVLAFCIVAVLVYMARFSGRLQVEQVRLIDAPPAEVQARIADLRCWPQWHPWLESEAALQITESGRPGQPRDRLSWGGPDTGSSAVEQLRGALPARIEQRLRLRQPFPFRGRCNWQFAGVDGKTRVRFKLKGRVAFAMRAFMPTVRGALELDFRHGLDRLAGLLEPAGTPRYAISYLGVREVPATHYASLRHEGSIEGLGAAVPARMEELRRQLVERRVPACGDPIAVYASTDIRRRTTVCHIGIPVAMADMADLPARELAAHRAYVVRLEGSRAGLEVAWYRAMQRLRVEGVQPDLGRAPFERCVGQASSPGEWGQVTELHLPVR